MTAILENWRQQARRAATTLALPESDVRVWQAAATLLQEGAVKDVALWGEPDSVLDAAAEAKVPLKAVSDRILWVARAFPDVAKWTADLWKAQQSAKGKTVVPEELAQFAASPLGQAGALAARGFVGGVVAGCVETTADVIRAALRTVGTQTGVKVLSGAFLMHRQSSIGDLPAHDFLFADCGVMIDPTAAELVDIAAASVRTFQALVPQVAPRVAFLSFSTKGSAHHPSQEKMAQAAAQFRVANPLIASDGELQFDAAYVPSVAARKASGSPIAGAANIFIFPNLDAGNISYKITQRLGGFQAFGPILQGTKVPFSDLSRGATSDDIVKSSYITIIRSLLS